MAHNITTINKKSICFVAGKSGGHIIPCLTLMQQKYKNFNILFFTTDTLLDSILLKQHSHTITHVTLPLGISYNNAWSTFLYLIWRLFVSFFISFKKLLQCKPQKIITTGGLIAVPVCIAAWLLRIPIYVYELNAIPGKANKLLTHFATEIYICFKDAQNFFTHNTCSIVTYPIRYTKKDKALSVHAARTHLGLKQDLFTIFIIGGSQGSIGLNTIIKTTIKKRNLPIQIIHQTGNNDTTDWNTFYKTHAISAYVFTFKKNLATEFTATDIVICRAGAGTLFETLYFKKRCIIVPLEGLGDNHQVANARAITKEYPKLCTMVFQQELALYLNTIEYVHLNQHTTSSYSKR